MFVSVVVPCFRSAATLPPLVARLAAALDGHTAGHEVILVVDDGAEDTWSTARGLADRHPNVQAIRLARNYGQHNALVAGARAARYEVLVTMDDDLQHPPEEVPVLLAALAPDVDLVYGVPVAEEHGACRSLASRLVKAGLTGVFGVRDARKISAFRAFRSFLVNGLENVSGPSVSVDVALAWASSRVATASVQMRERASGRSGYTLRTLLRHTTNMVLGYSTTPLRLVTVVGFATGALGVALLTQVVYQYLTGATTVAGYTTLASMVALFSAAQLVALGILGEYVGRIHANGMGRPTYVVRERVPGDGASGPPPAGAPATTREDAHQDALATAGPAPAQRPLP